MKCVSGNDMFSGSCQVESPSPLHHQLGMYLRASASTRAPTRLLANHMFPPAGGTAVELGHRAASGTRMKRKSPGKNLLKSPEPIAATSASPRATARRREPTPQGCLRTTVVGKNPLMTSVWRGKAASLCLAGPPFLGLFRSRRIIGSWRASMVRYGG